MNGLVVLLLSLLCFTGASLVYFIAELVQEKREHRDTKASLDSMRTAAHNYRVLWQGEQVRRRHELHNFSKYKRPTSTQFNTAEIKTLLSLCHPDRHGGKESAKRITQKLLELRK